MASTGVGGAGPHFTICDINSSVNLSSGVAIGTLTVGGGGGGGGLQELAPPTIFLTIHPSDQPDCSVYSLIPCKLARFHSQVAPPHKSDRPVLVSVY